MISATAVGRATHYPEITKTSAGKDFSKFQIACDHTKDEVTFLNVHVHGSLCRVLEFVTKGKLIAVQGELHVSKLEKDGKNIYYTFLSASKIELL